jgi:hypothetical protein
MRLTATCRTLCLPVLQLRKVLCVDEPCCLWAVPRKNVGHVTQFGGLLLVTDGSVRPKMVVGVVRLECGGCGLVYGCIGAVSVAGVVGEISGTNPSLHEDSL